ncbi:MAG: hypothetical protein KAI39_05810 [Desulfobulbaceae bacterium]|nr:hypothetical protein [Desulfobulbaceae bacterium]
MHGVCLITVAVMVWVTGPVISAFFVVLQKHLPHVESDPLLHTSIAWAREKSQGMV